MSYGSTRAQRVPCVLTVKAENNVHTAPSVSVVITPTSTQNARYLCLIFGPIIIFLTFHWSGIFNTLQHWLSVEKHITLLRNRPEIRDIFRNPAAQKFLLSAITHQASSQTLKIGGGTPGGHKVKHGVRRNHCQLSGTWCLGVVSGLFESTPHFGQGINTLSPCITKD